MSLDQFEQFLLRAYDRWHACLQQRSGVGAYQADQWEVLEGTKLVSQSQCQLASTHNQRSALNLKRPLVVLRKTMQWDVQQRLPDVAADSPYQNDLTRKQFIGLTEEGDNSQRCQCH
ncbi:hypothetical protein D3C78_1350970 [compost metagenome]